MPAPPLRTEISDTYPNPSNAVARAGFGKLYDYVVPLLGSTGNAAQAREALGVLGEGGGTFTGAIVAPQVSLDAEASWYKSGSDYILRFNSTGANRIQYEVASGSILFVTHAGTYRVSYAPEFWIPNFGVDGTTTARLGIGDATGVHLYQDSGTLRRLQFSNTGYLEFNNSNGNFAYVVSGASYLSIAGGTKALTAYGAALKPGGGSWTDSSDVRVKFDIQDYAAGLDEILQVQPKTYRFREETGRDTSVRYIGALAQEIEIPLPETVTAGPGKLGDLEFDDLRILDSSPLLWALVNAVKTLSTRLDDAHARIEALEASK